MGSSVLMQRIGFAFALTLLATCFAAAQQQPAAGKTAEQQYKNIKVMNGTPVDPSPTRLRGTAVTIRSSTPARYSWRA